MSEKDGKNSRVGAPKSRGGRPKLDKNDPTRAGLRGELVQVNVHFPADQVIEIDKVAGDLMLSRSGLIRLAVIQFMKKTPPTE